MNHVIRIAASGAVGFFVGPVIANFALGKMGYNEDNLGKGGAVFALAISDVAVALGTYWVIGKL